MQTIPVFYTISDDFTQYAAVSLNSLVKRVSPENNYVITFLHQDLTAKNMANLKSFERDNVKIEFKHIDDQLVKPIKHTEGNYLRADFFTMSIFYRLFIPDLFPQYDKGIYIDADTVVNDDIANLYNIDLEGNYFGACADLSIRFMPIMQEYIKECQGIFPPEKYINSGVLLLDMKAFRDKKFTDRFYYLINKYNVPTIEPDQSYLNEICEDKIKHLDPGWDAMPNENMDPIKNPHLVHYNLFFKPWHFGDVQYAQYFWDSAKETMYYDQLKEELNNFTEKDRANARKGLDHMLSKIDHIKNNPNSWAHVKERGEKVKL